MPRERSARTAYAVWEITLRCNLACVHCGSRAGSARSNELSTAEALDLVDQLAEVGITEVTLLGGEAFLRRDWLEIASAVVASGMRCTMTTGGWGITPAMAGRMKEAGIALVAVSVDGLERTHDTLRGRPGSWRRCFATMHHLTDAGIPIGCVTQVNRLSAPELPRLYEHLREARVRGWQVQLTGPMGNAADNAAILLQPPELLDLFPVLAHIARRAWREGVRFRPGQNVGFFGPFERLLRSNGSQWGFWRGPVEGLSAIGIESDGSVKPDPTVPSNPYIGGNIRDRPLRQIIEEAAELNLNMGAGTPASTAHLWGFCQTCEFATLCRGGDTFTAHVFFNRRGNHPYCHHRALVQRERGRRERLVLEVPAEGRPYDNGVFTVMEEPFDLPWPDDDELRFTAAKVVWPDGWPDGDDWDEPVGEGPVLAAAARRRPEAVLPRDGWEDDIVMLREIVRARAALDAAEARFRDTERDRVRPSGSRLPVVDDAVQERRDPGTGRVVAL
jgi:radical SAM protein with 4Fe4S-binding SPASM domain